MKFLSLLLILTTLWGDVDEQIDAIQNASAKERFKLMNAFKKKVILMKEKERIEAIKKLKFITKSPHSHKALEELKQNTQTNTQKQIENQAEEHIENATENQIGGENENERHD